MRSRDKTSGSLNGRTGTAAVALMAIILLGIPAMSFAQEMTKPQPEVPELFTLAGEFVRVAYNSEGFVTLGYRVANDSVAEEWMLLEVGVTLMKGVKNQKFTRESFSLKTPDGTIVPLASQNDFMEANLRALDRRASIVRDSINYFPATVSRGCTLNFFADPTQPGRSLAFDQVELSVTRACVGRIYFQVPGSIQTGQHWLVAKFANSRVEVPFRILTKAEEKEFRKNWKDLKKEHDAEMQ